MADIHGTCDGRFEAVRRTLAGNLDEGLDVGASVAVMVGGELVVDLWGGFADAARTRPWQRDTIINAWSISKPMTALCALILADRGEIDLHAPVSRYWPGFAAAGKERVEVRHLLGHTAGLSGWEQPLRAEDLYDWEKATALLAAQAPWWEPGSASGYHALTQGFLVGEVVRRVTGQSLGEFFAAEVAGPLGADFHIGLSPEHDERVALVIPSGPIVADVEPGSLAARSLGNPPITAETSWEPAWRRAEVPAANGHGNARSVAAVQAVLAGGGEVGGVRLLSPAGCDAVFEEQANGKDLVLGMPIRYGMGYGLNSTAFPVSPNPKACFWGGWGGSVVVVDVDAGWVVSYVMNRMGEGTLGDRRGAGIVLATLAALVGGGP